MATTFSYEVSPYKRTDGTHLIKIRMIHNREIVRKPSTIYVKREQLTRDLSKVKDAAVLDSINRQLDRFRIALAGIEGAEFYKASSLWDALVGKMKQKDGFALDFFVYADSVISKMEKSTANGYKSSLNALKRFLDRDTLDINEMTYKMLADFRAFLETEPALDNGKGKRKAKSKGCRAVSFYLSHLQHIHNLAREEYNDDDVGLIRIPRQPFKSGLIPKQPTTQHRALTAEQIRAISNSIPTTSLGILGRDVFVLSFALIGMNTVDLYNAKKGDLRDGVLTYNRSKTKNRRDDKAIMQVKIEPEAKAIIDRYHGARTLFGFDERHHTAKDFNKYVNKGLKDVGELVGIEGLTTYYARHSWATIARNDCGISRDIVGDALNHASRGSERVTDIYIERDFTKAWEANRKVLDLVFKK